MKPTLSIVLSLVAAAGVAGCHSGSSRSESSTQFRQSDYTTSVGDFVVVPAASRVAELSKPDVSVRSGAVTITGVARVRGPYNPDAVIRIVTIDRHGQESNEIHATLKESDTAGVLSYRANFAPVPDKGSSVSVSYQDWSTAANYSAAYGGGGSDGPSNGSAVKNGNASQGTNSGKGAYGGSTHRGGFGGGFGGAGKFK